MSEISPERGEGLVDALVAVSSLEKVFETPAERLTVLRDVNLAVDRATIVAIIGESGCGKSTLLNLIGGLDHPTSGRIVVDGIEVSGLPETEASRYRNRGVGFIFQFHFLLRDFTALENVLMPALVGRRPGDAGGAFRSRELRERARRLLADVGLAKRADAYPHELSGGERQRVAVARALVNDPPLLLADEPTGNLDERNARIGEELLFELVRRYQRTMMLVTHDTGLAGRADRGLVLAGGALSPA
jgi:lipoprotein-releasing system ATP-binding protein